ncbi:hypothetical protein VTI28DRAFT_4745 [Corynascus sepedonium]
MGTIGQQECSVALHAGENYNDVTGSRACRGHSRSAGARENGAAGGPRSHDAGIEAHSVLRDPRSLLMFGAPDPPRACGRVPQPVPQDEQAAARLIKCCSHAVTEHSALPEAIAIHCLQVVPSGYGISSRYGPNAGVPPCETPTLTVVPPKAVAWVYVTAKTGAGSPRHLRCGGSVTVV